MVLNAPWRIARMYEDWLFSQAVASSCSDAGQLDNMLAWIKCTFSQVPRRCLRWPPTPWDLSGPLQSKEVLHLYSTNGSHTHLLRNILSNY